MVRAYHAPSTVQQDGVPFQSWSASHTQWADGKMAGFVTSTEQAVPEGDKTAAMAYWTEEDLPFYHGLARTFPLADHWFSSCLGPTFPNRRFLLAGTANGLMDDLAYHAPSTVQQDGVPFQSWSASHTQWADGKMAGFVTSTEQAVPEGDKTAAMAYWTEEDLPFYHGLARTFPLADHWFSSCLGPTFPNRRFLLAGTANGLMDDLPFNLLDRPPAGTIMDQLTRHGISWVNYRAASSDQSQFRRYMRFRHRRARHHLGSLGRPLRKTSDVFKRDLQFTAAIYPLGMAGYMAHVRSIEQFFADADSGNLPSFSLVDPDFRVFSEESPQDVRKGESFAAEVISRVMHGPGWAHRQATAAGRPAPGLASAHIGVPVGPHGRHHVPLRRHRHPGHRPRPRLVALLVPDSRDRHAGPGRNGPRVPRRASSHRHPRQRAVRRTLADRDHDADQAEQERPQPRRPQAAGPASAQDSRRRSGNHARSRVRARQGSSMLRARQMSASSRP